MLSCGRAGPVPARRAGGNAFADGDFVAPKTYSRAELSCGFGQNSGETRTPMSATRSGELMRSSKAERFSASRMPKGIPNPAAMYGIYSRSWGFEVSLVRNGIRHHKLFGKASYGSAEQALLHAQDWRDFIVRSVPPVERRVRAQKPRANNTTGIPGVFHQLAPGGKVRGWMAKTYIAQDEILRADFPVDGLGEAAHALAVQERAQQLKRMKGLARLHPAEEAIRMGLSAHPHGPRAPKRSKSEITRRNNTSGVSGVHFKTPNPAHPGYWLAITYTAGKGSVSKAFSVKEHGPDTAKRLAIAERENQLAEKMRGLGSPDSPASALQQQQQPHSKKSRGRTAPGAKQDT